MFEPIYDRYIVDESTAQAVIRAAQDSLGECPSNTKMAVFRGRKTPPGSPVVDPGAFYEVVF
jgi:hypothetical protein